MLPRRTSASLRHCTRVMVCCHHSILCFVQVIELIGSARTSDGRDLHRAAQWEGRLLPPLALKEAMPYLKCRISLKPLAVRSLQTAIPATDFVPHHTAL